MELMDDKAPERVYNAYVNNLTNIRTELSGIVIA